MSVRYEVSNREVHDVILTVGRKNVGQSEALPHPESDRPAPFPVVVVAYSRLQRCGLHESRCISRVIVKHEGMLCYVVTKYGPKK